MHLRMSPHRQRRALNVRCLGTAESAVLQDAARSALQSFRRCDTCRAYKRQTCSRAIPSKHDNTAVYRYHDRIATAHAYTARCLSAQRQQVCTTSKGIRSIQPRLPGSG